MPSKWENVQIPDDEGAPEESYNVNVLMSTTKFGFKDLSVWQSFYICP